jgi:hypothetical protein
MVGELAPTPAERAGDAPGPGGAAEITLTIGHQNLHDLDVHHDAMVRP